MVIYMAVNKVNGKKYIGQTSQDFKKRILQHFHKKDNNYFDNAVSKYGIGRFEWVILEECDSIETLNFREQCYIAEFGTLKPHGYNLRGGGESGGSLHPETKKKLREARLGTTVCLETRKKISKSISGENHPWFGKKHSEESKKKNSVAHIGKVKSLETIEKLRISMLGKNTGPRPEYVKAKLRIKNLGKKYSFESKLKHSGENSGCAKLTLEKVIKIKEKIKEGIVFRKIAEEFRVSDTCIQNISSGRTWKNFSLEV